MGTSTWHRSPQTEQWQRVRELYAQPDASPAEVVSRIVSALDDVTRRGMRDAAVVTCLGTMIEGSQRVAAEGLGWVLGPPGVGHGPAAIQIAAGLRDRAEGLIAQHALASRFGDLALEAVGTTALAIAALRTSGTGIMELPATLVEDNFAGDDRGSRLHEIAALFTGHELERAFRHFVARDIGDFVGGPGLPTISHASRLEDAVGAHCRAAWRALRLEEYEALLAPTLHTPPAERLVLLQPVMSAAVAQGLHVLGSGGV
ncbi:MAG: hypothetical protein AB7Y46_13610 [Armatimonadota bacterium]